MASSLLEIFVPAPHAIPIPDDKTKAHSQVTVVIKGRQQTICKGGIVSANKDNILKTGMSQFKTSYIEQLPHQFPHSETKNMRKQLQQFKCVIPSSYHIPEVSLCAMLLVTCEIPSWINLTISTFSWQYPTFPQMAFWYELIHLSWNSSLAWNY